MKNELVRLMRAYIVVLAVVVFIFGVGVGVTVAKNNTRRTSFGEKIEIAGVENYL